MALHADLMVNGRRIGWVYAQRTSPAGRPADDDVCRYLWRLGRDGQPQRGGEGLEHRYGDGPWALVARIVDAAAGDRSLGT